MAHRDSRSLPPATCILPCSHLGLPVGQVLAADDVPPPGLAPIVLQRLLQQGNLIGQQRPSDSLHNILQYPGRGQAVPKGRQHQRKGSKKGGAMPVQAAERPPHPPSSQQPQHLRPCRAGHRTQALQPAGCRHQASMHARCRETRLTFTQLSGALPATRFFLRLNSC